MRILLLSEAASIHTQRWATALHERGVELAVFSLRDSNNDAYTKLGVPVISAASSAAGQSSLWAKLGYLTALGKLRRTIAAFRPDILHAHYATSYGLLGALAQFHPYIVSVWGADVYDFPHTAPLGEHLLRYVFRKADRVLSTSNVMAKEAAKYTSKPFGVTPFGVDTSLFRPVHDVEPDLNLFGCVKALRKKYGIDVLLRAFSELVGNNPARSLRLEIAGDGEDRAQLEALAQELDIAERVTFKGFVPNGSLPTFYSRYLVSVFPSVLDSESFGVVAVESMSCECPVIASDVDGFRETVDDGNTGILVARGEPHALAQAMQRFIDDPDMRSAMGKSGRARVEQLYRWQDNVETMLELYRSTLRLPQSEADGASRK